MDSLQEKLVGFWKQIQMEEEVDPSVNFFEAGGTSVNIIQLYGILDEEYPQVISIDDIFSNPSVDALAQLIKERTNVGQNESSEIDF